MNLRKRTLVLIALTLASLIVIVFLASQRIFLDAFNKLEQRYAQQSVSTAIENLNEQIRQLGVNAADWAAWDDSYRYMQSQNSEFERSNLVPSTFITLRIQILAMVDPAGKVVYAQAYDLQKGDFIALPAGLIDMLQPGSPAVTSGPVDLSETGIVMLPDGPLLVATHPILTSEHQGPAAGTLLMGRWLNTSEINRVIQPPATSAALAAINAPLPSADFSAARAAIKTPSQVIVQPLDNDTIGGYGLLHDLSGNPVLILRVLQPRDIMQQARSSLLLFILMLAGVGLLFGALILFWLENRLLSRLFQLSDRVERIRLSDDLSLRLEEDGHDELASLATAINKMLGALQQSRQDLRTANDALEGRVHTRTIELAQANENLMVEVAERRRAEEQIRAALVEKDVLLKEIHHRVKNNLQVVSSMLYLKSQRIKDVEAREMFQDSQNRIKSMALIHERLYQSEDLSHIEFGDYVEALVRDLFLSYGADPDLIGYQVNVNGTQLNIDHAIPCGLIINELVTNSLKYAFPGSRPGEICIQFSHAGPEYVLKVSDNGTGFPQEIDFRTTHSLGLQLVNRLVDQLDGEIQQDHRSGTSYTIRFRDQN